MNRTLKRLTLTLLILFGLLCLPLVLLSVKDYGPDFQKERGKLTGADVRPAAGDSLSTKSWVTLRNSRGFTVECGMLIPRGPEKRFPAVILLGGKATGKYAVDYALGIRNVIIIAPDYPYTPRESYTVWNFLQDVPAIRKALFDMVPSVMLATDYLMSRADVDTGKIVLLGYSFGAPFVPCIIAHDRRAAVAAMVYGGGDVPSLIAHNVERFEGRAAGAFAGSLSWLLLRPLEPMRYVDRIAPIPLIMINGTHDEQVPRANTEMLFAKAREPKRIFWMESRHVNPANVDLTRKIIATLAGELHRLGITGSSSP